MTIAILAMQGAFLEHGQMLDRLGVEHFEIRKKEDLDRSFDGLILPGGESTVMRKLLIELDIYDILKEKIEDGLPVFGTCAGLILLAEQVEDGVPCFGTMNILAKRNAYGRQLGSFYTEDEMKEIGKIPMTFTVYCRCLWNSRDTGCSRWKGCGCQTGQPACNCVSSGTE